MKIRLLLVEDEEIILEAMKLCIENAGLDIEVLTASNGAQALEIARRERPQVVLSDIEMPQMDGLTFLQEMKALNGDSQIYVVSGYQNFEYAKKAIDIGVKKYIIKPFEEAALLALIGEAKAFLTKQREQDSRSRYREDYARRSLLSVLVRGQALTDDLQEALPALLPCDQFQLAYIRLDAGRDRESSEAIALSNATLYIDEIIQGVLPAAGLQGVFTPMGEDAFVLLLHLETEADLGRTGQMMIRICHEINGRLHSGATVCLSTACRGAGQVREAYGQCVHALGQQWCAGSGAVLQFVRAQEDIEPLCLTFRQLLDQGLYAELSSVVSRIFGALATGDGDLAQPRRIATELLDALYRARFHSDHPVPSLERQPTLHGIRTLVVQAANSLREYDSLSVSQTEGLVLRARRHIDENLKDVTLRTAAEAVGVTPIYMSTIFRASTGQRFIDYVTKARIEAAKEMLKDPTQKVHAIAQRLGYLDSKHFSRIFKRNTGVTPNEFKLSIMKETYNSQQNKGKGEIV